MSSKSTHQVAGLALATAFALYANADLGAKFVFLSASILGSSAPDWMEIAKWETHRRWFAADESVRTSIIPHRTITHTAAIWIVAVVVSSYILFTGSYSLPHIFFWGFCLSGLTHLLLDCRTKMGIPLLPLGKRYRFTGLKFVLAKEYEKRRGWL